MHAPRARQQVGGNQDVFRMQSPDCRDVGGLLMRTLNADGSSTSGEAFLAEQTPPSLNTFVSIVRPTSLARVRTCTWLPVQRPFTTVLFSRRSCVVPGVLTWQMVTSGGVERMRTACSHCVFGRLTERPYSVDIGRFEGFWLEGLGRHRSV